MGDRVPSGAHDTGGTSRKRRMPGIWKYGDVEFHLTDDRRRVRLIFCDCYQRLGLGDAAELEPWFFDGRPGCEVVERELAAAGIPYQREDMPQAPECYLLRLESGVELLFSKGMDAMVWPGSTGLFAFQHVERDAVG